MGVQQQKPFLRRSHEKLSTPPYPLLRVLVINELSKGVRQLLRKQRKKDRRAGRV